MSSATTAYELAADINAWFSELPTRIRKDVLRLGALRLLDADEALYLRGDPPDGIYLVKSGVVRLSGASDEGREIVLDYFGGGAVFGETSMFDGLPRMHDARANGAAEVLHLPPKAYRQLQKQPAFAAALYRLGGLRTRILLTALRDYSAQSMEHRLATRLLILANGHGVEGEAGEALNLHLPHDALAQLVGSTRQRVNQILNEWESKGLIAHHYGAILLKDKSRLQALASH